MCTVWLFRKEERSDDQHLLSWVGRVPSGHSQKVNVSPEGAQLSFLMSWRAVTSTGTEGPMVEVTYRLRQ
jgi:hypothetical protein